MLRSIAHELVGPRFWRYAQNISGGLQEYIEALSFVHYIEHGRLVSYEQVQAILCDDTGHHVGPVYAIFGTCTLRNRPGLSTALPATVVRLCPWDMRPHWRVDAPRHLFDIQAQRPHESLADLPIRQRLQSW
jgi:hypothetical protein